MPPQAPIAVANASYTMVPHPPQQQQLPPNLANIFIAALASHHHQNQMHAAAQQFDTNNVVSALLHSIAQGGSATPLQQEMQNELLRLVLRQQVQLMQAQNFQQVPPQQQLQPQQLATAHIINHANSTSSTPMSSTPTSLSNATLPASNLSSSMQQQQHHHHHHTQHPPNTVSQYSFAHPHPQGAVPLAQQNIANEVFEAVPPPQMPAAPRAAQTATDVARAQMQQQQQSQGFTDSTAYLQQILEAVKKGDVSITIDTDAASSITGTSTSAATSSGDKSSSGNGSGSESSMCSGSSTLAIKKGKPGSPATGIRLHVHHIHHVLRKSGEGDDEDKASKDWTGADKKPRAKRQKINGKASTSSGTESSSKNATSSSKKESSSSDLSKASRNLLSLRSDMSIDLSLSSGSMSSLTNNNAASKAKSKDKRKTNLHHSHEESQDSAKKDEISDMSTSGSDDRSKMSSEGSGNHSSSGSTPNKHLPPRKRHLAVSNDGNSGSSNESSRSSSITSASEKDGSPTKKLRVEDSAPKKPELSKRLSDSGDFSGSSESDWASNEDSLAVGPLSDTTGGLSVIKSKRILSSEVSSVSGSGSDNISASGSDNGGSSGSSSDNDKDVEVNARASRTK